MKRIIIVTGTPCTGKTSVSKKLAAKLDASHVDLAELVKREKLYCGIDKERNSIIADLDKVSQRIKEVIQEAKGDVIIDGHYAVHVVNPETVDFVFVLRKDPRRLKVLMERRGYSGKKLWENLEAEILDVCLLEAIDVCGKDKVCEIDTTDMSIDEAVDEVLRVINGERKCGVGIVDWLGKLEREGVLEDFLKNLP